MSIDSATPLTLRTPYDVIGAVPHLLGFTPSESLVVILLRGRCILLTLRLDLPERAGERDLVDDLVARAVHARAEEVLLLCFTAGSDRLLRGAPGSLPRRWLVRRAGRALSTAGLVHRESLLVAQGRWWSYTCTDPRCCPPAGTPVPPPSPTLLTLSAERALSGRTVLASREELARSVEPALLAGPDQPPAAGPAGAAERRLICRLYDDTVAGSTTLDATARAQLARALADVEFRDDVLGWLGQVDPVVAMALLADLCRQVGDADAAPVCSVLAWAACCRGDGGLANVALERALRCSPGYSLALLVGQLLARQVPPDELQRMAAELPCPPSMLPTGD